jgi:hypothetical protein
MRVMEDSDPTLAMPVPWMAAMGEPMRATQARGTAEPMREMPAWGMGEPMRATQVRGTAAWTPD